MANTGYDLTSVVINGAAYSEVRNYYGLSLHTS
jgi:hypothetical protein